MLNMTRVTPGSRDPLICFKKPDVETKARERGQWERRVSFAASPRDADSPRLPAARECV